MPKAIEVANELRKLADSIEKLGQSEVTRPFVYFSYLYKSTDTTKDDFLALASILPRPLKKKYSDHELRLEIDTEGLNLTTAIERSKVCTLVEEAKPAVYKCEPLLSEEEENLLASTEKESNEIPF